MTLPKVIQLENGTPGILTQMWPQSQCGGDGHGQSRGPCPVTEGDKVSAPGYGHSTSQGTACYLSPKP